ncbi:MAG: GNAT family N-acetyltransferase [Thermomicrobiales bacterium]
MTHAPVPGAREPLPNLALVLMDPARHDASSFACGNAALDAYIRETIHRDLTQGTAAAYVWTLAAGDTTPPPILGYFTVSSFALERRQARRRDRDRFLGGYDPVPAVLIGRLAIDQSLQRRGLGSALVYAALERVVQVRSQLGVAVVVVHAIDERAATFYAHLGFDRFRDEPLHLYYPLARFAQESD